MSRQRKCRKVCCLPRFNEFKPIIKGKSSLDVIILSVDEYETIRLIDYENFTQEQCANYMKVARTTVQLIYNNARKKLASSIINGTILKIEGGDYNLCEGKEQYCNCGGCLKHKKLAESI